eukprot:6092266-Amphidinium_carterae.2
MLYQRRPWQQLLEDGAMVMFDQCATGLTNSRGEPVQKRTDIRASSETLVSRLRSRQCRCTVPHATLEGKETKLAQIWTWQLAQVMALSIMDTLHAHLDKVPIVHPAFLFHDYDHRELMYNVNKRDFEEQYQVYGTMDGFGCPACKGHIARHDNRHTRDLEGEFNCKYTGEEPVEWACEGCRAHKPYLHDAHTWLPGECALASTRLRSTRRGTNPQRVAREPRSRASQEPTARIKPPREGFRDDAAMDIHTEAAVPRHKVYLTRPRR